MCNHSTDFEGFSSDETVRVVMSGNQEPRGVDITQEAYAQVGLIFMHCYVTSSFCKRRTRR